MSKKIICLTMGEPSSIAPFLAIKAHRALMNNSNYKILFIGNENILYKTANFMNVSLHTKTVNSPEDARALENNVLPIIPINIQPCQPGSINNENSSAVLESINIAVDLCKAGLADAMVTSPIEKSSIAIDLDSEFSGHTEYIAQRLNKPNPIMMFTNGDIHKHVALLSTHVSLQDAINYAKKPNIVSKVQFINEYFKKFYKSTLNIAISGLNPHASEGELFGLEEKEEIIPAIKELQSLGINASGPYPGDTMYNHLVNSKCNCALFMYHDQALGPFKALNFSSGINVTANIDIIRTSPDHGTAMDIAKRYHEYSAIDSMSADSLINAIEFAYKVIIAKEHNAL